MEEMDLINTVNQLLLENGKLKSDKVALEEEVKNQRRSNVLERVKSVVTARDVALCANNKVQIFSQTSCRFPPEPHETLGSCPRSIRYMIFSFVSKLGTT